MIFFGPIHVGPKDAAPCPSLNDASEVRHQFVSDFRRGDFETKEKSDFSDKTKKTESGAPAMPTRCFGESATHSNDQMLLRVHDHL